jgi:hypothetical protein
MSRLYRISIIVTEYDENQVEAIFDAITQEWDIDHHYCHPASTAEAGPRFLCASGDSYLCGGESEEDFADRVALGVWQAIGGYCHIKVDATYLDDLPCETHIRDDDDYYHLVKPERK